ncbi:MAG: hypothetical protein DRH11_07890 [Deltaproteobacteria bacterium]|nr:MAG: hypothetical protein DRH11_07890 [Deltaproteobacteria bacterium]
MKADRGKKSPRKKKNNGPGLFIIPNRGCDLFFSDMPVSSRAYWSQMASRQVYHLGERLFSGFFLSPNPLILSYPGSTLKAELCLAIKPMALLFH